MALDKSRLMAGKRGLILGVANDHSIAWGIAQRLAAHGAELAFTYQDEAFQRRVEPLAKSVGGRIVLPCDVADADSLDRVFGRLADAWSGLDFVVHAIAFSDKSELRGRYLDTTRENFLKTLHISCFSLTKLARRARPMMLGSGGSLLTLTYLGSARVMPSYNVMGVAKAALEASVRYLAHDLGPKGIRVNAISAGPLRTLAAAGISDFKSMLHHVAERAPLKRNIDAEEVGKSALYLCSDWGSAVTGEVVHVDAGYNIMGM